MLTATFALTTLLVAEVFTPVETKTKPVAAGNVTVFVPAIAGAASVVAPLVSPVIMIELIFI
jgi:hypothetical protein